MLELTLASGNVHKKKEFAKLFDPQYIVVKNAPIQIEVIEDGESYFENALLKAKAYYENLKVPVLSDDSGLSVLALPEDLGVHSARFGGLGLTDQKRAELLLKKMEGVINREAFFTCVLCVYFNEREIFYFEGRMNGSIAHRYQGTGGFGYDPVFVPNEKQKEGSTLAEISEWKELHSHRKMASAFAQKFLQERN